MLEEKQNKKTDVAKREEEILKFWQENKIFEKSLEKDSPNGEFVFYDGPPFATGLPHYGSLLSSIVKDLFGRYKTMRGYYVRRRWGWDCHGLPVESVVEKDLGLKTKKDIEKMGIQKFIEGCRNSVLTYTHEWEKYIDRTARWVEFQNSYKTMDATYMESVWWTIKQIYDKELLYEGMKVLLYCPRCETPLAKAEIAMDNSYQDVTEETVTIRFKLTDPEKYNLPKDTSVLAWTTTPWTLPGNVSLAVGEEIEYSLVEKDGENLVLAKDLVKKVLGEDAKEIKTFSGKELLGATYEPLFEIPAVRESGKNAWLIVPADFVSTEEGTGVVHTAVIHGEEDYQLGLDVGLPMVQLLDKTGKFNDLVPELIKGKYFKDSEDVIKDDLEKRGLMFERKEYTHSYPHCYRCGTALLYNALSSWFINIQKIKSRLLELNEKMNWVPDYLKHGRFQYVMENAPDWNISRNRFWSSPLPIWKCDSCNKIEVIGSVEQLQEKSTGHSGNKYFLMRHGQADSNVKNYVSSNPEFPDHLTEEGKKQSKEAAVKLKNKEIEIIVHSGFVRTKETAEIIAKELGIKKENIFVDNRIGEQHGGDYEGKTWEDFDLQFDSLRHKYVGPAQTGESYLDQKKRLMEFLFEINSKYSNKNILVVSHAGAIANMYIGSRGLSEEEAIAVHESGEWIFTNAEFKELDFWQFPHNENYELDLHRPYIDEIKIKCECGKEIERIPEVIDGWVESACMPFAEYHYPFENKEEFEKRRPGDFVAEYIAQTRTWFYYMHVIATILFDDVSFVNVVTTGNILASDGRKMSKSLRNYTDPLENISNFGADALRFYMMTSVVMQAEDIKFDDSELKEVYQRVLNLLWNTLRFYKTYAEDCDGKTKHEESKNVLDKWIIAKFELLKKEVTSELDKYNTVKGGRPFKSFVADLSQWYVRRSRDRFKTEGEDKPSFAKATEDKQYALATLQYVFLELSKLLAPFTPYVAEEIYKTAGGKLESVHLENWPQAEETRNKKQETNIIEQMEETRKLVSLALEKRSAAGIKVRQPLGKLTLKTALPEEFLQLIQSELNVKEVVTTDSGEELVVLDTEITDELKKEGQFRELVRFTQGIRKEMKLIPSDVIKVKISTDAGGEELVKKFEDEFKAKVIASEISFEQNQGKKLDANNLSLVIEIEKQTRK